MSDSWLVSHLHSKIDLKMTRVITSTEENACLLTRDSSHGSNSSIHYPLPILLGAHVGCVGDISWYVAPHPSCFPKADSRCYTGNKWCPCNPNEFLTSLTITFFICLVFSGGKCYHVELVQLSRLPIFLCGFLFHLLFFNTTIFTGLESVSETHSDTNIAVL